MLRDISVDWFIALMKELKLSGDEGGICFGFCWMLIQAVLAEDLKSYDKRMKYIQKRLDDFLDNENLPKKYHQEFAKMLVKEIETLKKLIKKTAKENAATQLLGGTQPLTSRDFANFKQNLTIPSVKENFNYLFRAFSSKQFDSLNNEEKQLLSIPIFLTGIELYHNGFNLNYLQPTNKKIFQQDGIHMAALAASIKIQERGGIERLAKFISCFQNLEEFTSLLLKLDKLIKNIQPALGHPISFAVGSIDHEIQFSYLPNQGWFLTNPTMVSFEREIVSIEKIAAQIFTIFSIKEDEEFDSEEENNSEEASSENEDTKVTQNKEEENEEADLKMNPVIAIKTEIIIARNIFMVNRNNVNVFKVTDAHYLIKENDSSWTLIYVTEDKETITLQLNPEHISAMNALEEQTMDNIYPLIKSALYQNCFQLRLTNVLDKWFRSDEFVFMHHQDLFARAKLFDSHGGSLLYLAAMDGNFTLTKQLLDFGVDPNQIANPKEPHYPLYIAVQHNHCDVAALLLKHGASPNLLSENGYPIYRAVENDNDELTRLLLNYGADIHLVAKDNYLDNEAIFNYLTTQQKAEFTGFEHTGHLLCLAIDRNNLKIVHLLLEKNFNVNMKAPNGDLPLYLAVKKGQIEIVRLLLAAGANPHILLGDGTSYLLLAVQNNQPEIVELLCKYGTDVNLENDQGLTPLFMAAQNGYLKVAEILLQYHANPNIISDNNQDSPLFVACENGHKEIVYAMLRKGTANVNQVIDDRSASGITPLFAAVRNQHHEIAKNLLRYGADKYFEHEDKSIIQQATENEDKEMLNMLQTPLHLRYGPRNTSISEVEELPEKPRRILEIRKK